MSAFITLHVNLTPEAASALASFVKKANYRDFKGPTDNEVEAFHMVSAAHAINGALVNQGHTQRIK